MEWHGKGTEFAIAFCQLKTFLPLPYRNSNLILLFKFCCLHCALAHSLKHSIDCRWWCCWCENRFNPVEIFHVHFGQMSHIHIPHSPIGCYHLNFNHLYLFIYFWFNLPSDSYMYIFHGIVSDACNNQNEQATNSGARVFVSVCLTLFILDFIFFIRSNSNVICVETNKLEVSTISHHFQIIKLCTVALSIDSIG